MKVKELVEELEKCNPDASVVTDGGGGVVIEVKNLNHANSTANVVLITN